MPASFDKIATATALNLSYRRHLLTTLNLMYNHESGEDPAPLAQDLPRAVPAAGLVRDGLRHHPHPHHGQQAPPGGPAGGRRHRHGHAGRLGGGPIYNDYAEGHLWCETNSRFGAGMVVTLALKRV